MIYPLVAIIFKTISRVPKFIVADKSRKSFLKQEWANDILTFLRYKIIINGDPPSFGSHILVGNHISFIDIPVILSVIPNAIFIAKDDLRRWPILGFCIALAGTVFVSRKVGADRSQTRKQILDNLKSSEELHVVVFPSGTTSLDESRPWKKGIFEVAQQAGIKMKAFKITHMPLRVSAYIDDDNFIEKLSEIFKTNDKCVTISWLESFDSDGDPTFVAETIRKQVVNFEK